MIQYRRQLVDLIKEKNLPLIAAELGVAEGLFSNDLLSAGLEKLYMVDNWGEIKGQSGDGGSPQEWHDKNYENAVELLKPFGDKSVILKGISYEVVKNIPDNTLGLGYIDCDHSKLGVLRDIEAIYPKVVSGGIIAFHDYENENYGVKDAVQEFVAGRFEIFLLPENKPEDAGAFFIKP